jgi:hypothetical protein
MIDLSKSMISGNDARGYECRSHICVMRAHLLFGVPRGRAVRDTPAVGRVNQALPSGGCENVRARQKSRAVSLGYF